MIIDALTALPSTPTTGDELPIERGTTTYKVDYDALATAIINKLGTVLKPADVVNDLTSTATDKPLSAAQGKALKEAIATGGANYLQLPGGTYICWGSAIITAGTDRVNIAFSAFAQAPIIVISANNKGTFRVNNVSTYYAIIACNEGNVSSDETIYWVAFGTK